MRSVAWIVAVSLVAGCASRPDPEPPPVRETTPVAARASEPPVPWLHEHPPLLLEGTLPPEPPPILTEAEALRRASVDGKYTKLLTSIAVPDDLAAYGVFRDWGRWEGTSYAGFEGLPPGNWVYVYPRWYVWE